MHIIGLTGGIACGKSTVSSILHTLGAYVIDVDKIAHNIIQYGKPAWVSIVTHFGSNILDNNNSINRSVLGNIVFYDQKKLKILEQIMHPIIKQVVKVNIENAICSNFKITVLDAPLLLEANWISMVNEIWVIVAPKNIQIKRLVKRDNITIKNAINKIKHQMKLSDKITMADVVINNKYNIIDLEKKVLIEWKRIIDLTLKKNMYFKF